MHCCTSRIFMGVVIPKTVAGVICCGVVVATNVVEGVDVITVEVGAGPDEGGHVTVSDSRSAETFNKAPKLHFLGSSHTSVLPGLMTETSKMHGKDDPSIDAFIWSVIIFLVPVFFT